MKIMKILSKILYFSNFGPKNVPFPKNPDNNFYRVLMPIIMQNFTKIYRKELEKGSKMLILKPKIHQFSNV